MEPILQWTLGLGASSQALSVFQAEAAARWYQVLQALPIVLN